MKKMKTRSTQKQKVNHPVHKQIIGRRTGKALQIRNDMQTIDDLFSDSEMESTMEVTSVAGDSNTSELSSIKSLKRNVITGTSVSGLSQLSKTQNASNMTRRTRNPIRLGRRTGKDILAGKNKLTVSTFFSDSDVSLSFQISPERNTSSSVHPVESPEVRSSIMSSPEITSSQSFKSPNVSTSDISPERNVCSASKNQSVEMSDVGTLLQASLQQNSSVSVDKTFKSPNVKTAPQTSSEENISSASVSKALKTQNVTFLQTSRASLNKSVKESLQSSPKKNNSVSESHTLKSPIVRTSLQASSGKNTSKASVRKMSKTPDIRTSLQTSPYQNISQASVNEMSKSPDIGTSLQPSPYQNISQASVNKMLKSPGIRTSIQPSPSQNISQASVSKMSKSPGIRTSIQPSASQNISQVSVSKMSKSPDIRASIQPSPSQNISQTSMSKMSKSPVIEISLQTFSGQDTSQTTVDKSGKFPSTRISRISQQQNTSSASVSQTVKSTNVIPPLQTNVDENAASSSVSKIFELPVDSASPLTSPAQTTSTASVSQTKFTDVKTSLQTMQEKEINSISTPHLALHFEGTKAGSVSSTDKVLENEFFGIKKRLTFGQALIDSTEYISSKIMDLSATKRKSCPGSFLEHHSQKKDTTIASSMFVETDVGSESSDGFRIINSPVIVGKENNSRKSKRLSVAEKLRTRKRSGSKDLVNKSLTPLLDRGSVNKFDDNEADSIDHMKEVGGDDDDHLPQGSSSVLVGVEKTKETRLRDSRHKKKSDKSQVDVGDSNDSIVNINSTDIETKTGYDMMNTSSTSIVSDGEMVSLKSRKKIVLDKGEGKVDHIITVSRADATVKTNKKVNTSKTKIVKSDKDIRNGDNFPESNTSDEPAETSFSPADVNEESFKPDRSVLKDKRKLRKQTRNTPSLTVTKKLRRRKREEKRDNIESNTETDDLDNIALSKPSPLKTVPLSPVVVVETNIVDKKSNRLRRKGNKSVLKTISSDDLEDKISASKPSPLNEIEDLDDIALSKPSPPETVSLSPVVETNTVDKKSNRLRRKRNKSVLKSSSSDDLEDKIAASKPSPLNETEDLDNITLSKPSPRKTVSLSPVVETNTVDEKSNRLRRKRNKSVLKSSSSDDLEDKIEALKPSSPKTDKDSALEVIEPEGNNSEDSSASPTHNRRHTIDKKSVGKTSSDSSVDVDCKGRSSGFSLEQHRRLSKGLKIRRSQKMKDPTTPIHLHPMNMFPRITPKSGISLRRKSSFLQSQPRKGIDQSLQNSNYEEQVNIAEEINVPKQINVLHNRTPVKTISSKKQLSLRKAAILESAHRKAAILKSAHRKAPRVVMDECEIEPDSPLVNKINSPFAGYEDSTVLPTPSSTPVHYAETTVSQKRDSYSPFIPDPSRKIIYPDMDSSGLRRSKRTRVQRLEGYKGEGVVYRRDSTGFGMTVDRIQPSLGEAKVLLMEREKNKRRKKRKCNEQYAALQRTFLAHVKVRVCGHGTINHQLTTPSTDVFERVLAKAVPAKLRRMSAHCAVQQEVTDSSEISVVNPDTDQNVHIALVAHNEDVSWVGPDLSPVTSRDSISLCTLLNQPSFSTGQLHIRPLCEKPQEITTHTVVFFLIHGKICVTVNNSSFIVENQDDFFIPRGSMYKIKNLRGDIAQLKFFNFFDFSPNKKN